MGMRNLLSQIMSRPYRSALFILAVAGFGAAAIQAKDVDATGDDATTTLSGASCDAVEDAKTEEVYFTSCGGFI